jgi:hypothetical protein
LDLDVDDGWTITEVGVEMDGVCEIGREAVRVSVYDTPRELQTLATSLALEDMIETFQ